MRARRAGASFFVGILLLVAPSQATVDAQADAERGTVIVRLADLPGEAQVGTPSLAEDGYLRMEVPEGQDAETYAASLKGAPGILSAQADAPVNATDAPNDPFYGIAQSSYLEALEVEQAWNLATGSNTVIVAVIDTGLDTSHEDFAGRLWQNPLDSDGDGVDDDGNGCIDDRYGCRFISGGTSIATCGYGASLATGAVQDDHGRPGDSSHSHGTLVAGILGAAGNNGRGVAGIAWNVNLMTVKVLDCGRASADGSPGGQMSDVALGIDYARRMGANIINLSLASFPGNSTADLDIIRSAIEAARAQDVIIVAAAGNDGIKGVGFPAAYTEYSNVLGVGASNSSEGNIWASYSGVGEGVDFAAPGNDIASTFRSDLELAPPPYGVAKSGTSFSTPLVTGMFALMKSRNSALGHENLIQFAKTAATPASTVGQLGNWAGAGIINIGAALALLPMTVNGDALADWLYLEPGVRMRAFVGSTECGSTTTESFGPATRFSMRVSSAAERAGCGRPGAEVQFLVGGDQAQTKLAWGRQDEDLAQRNRHVVVVSSPPGPTVVQRGTSGWSLAAHMPSGGTLPGAVPYLSPSWTEIHAWQGGTAENNFASFVQGLPQYAQGLNSIAQFDIFWVNGTQSIMASPKPNYASGRKVFLDQGWNAFVFTGESREVSEALAAIEGAYEQVMQYDNKEERWLSYLPGQARWLQDFGGLIELQIYWVYASTGGLFFSME